MAPPGSEDDVHLCDLVAEIVPAVEAMLLSVGPRSRRVLTRRHAMILGWTC